MKNLTKFKFVALYILGKNYLLWTLDVEIHLTVNNFGDKINDENKVSPQEKAKAIILPLEDLKTEYLTVKDPLELWKNLKKNMTIKNKCSSEKFVMNGFI
jgi:hypothetical protein